MKIKTFYNFFKYYNSYISTDDIKFISICKFILNNNKSIKQYEIEYQKKHCIAVQLENDNDYICISNDVYDISTYFRESDKLEKVKKLYYKKILKHINIFFKIIILIIQSIINLIDTIKDLFDKFKTFIYNFKIGIRNLKNWFRVIWKHRDWDSYFTFEILKHSLYQMRQCHINSNMKSTKTHDIIKQLKQCENILDRISKKDYNYENNNIHYPKYSNNHSDYMRKQDLDILFTKIKKWENRWWD